MSCFRLSSSSRTHRDRIFAILFLISLIPSSGVCSSRAGGSLNLYTDRFVDRQGVNAAIFQSINPILYHHPGAALCLALGGSWQARAGDSAPAKFGLALAQIGSPFWFSSGARTTSASAPRP
jgi:POT family proton-dependent oligopeptide transporter